LKSNDRHSVDGDTDPLRRVSHIKNNKAQPDLQFKSIAFEPQGRFFDSTASGKARRPVRSSIRREAPQRLRSEPQPALDVTKVTCVNRGEGYWAGC
jgi:hypothetical protein